MGSGAGPAEVAVHTEKVITCAVRSRESLRRRRAGKERSRLLWQARNQQKKSTMPAAGHGFMLFAACVFHFLALIVVRCHCDAELLWHISGFPDKNTPNTHARGVLGVLGVLGDLARTHQSSSHSPFTATTGDISSSQPTASTFGFLSVLNHREYPANNAATHPSGSPAHLIRLSRSLQRTCVSRG